MTDALLPHEDPDPAKPYLDYRGSLELEPAPRRGYPSARTRVPLEGMPELWQKVRGLAAEPLSAAIESKLSDPEVAAALKAYLDGEPDPLGAATAFVTAAAVLNLYEIARQYVQFDAWTEEHGTDFAVLAAMRQCEIRVLSEQTGKPYVWLRYRQDTPAVQFAPAEPAGAVWGRGPDAFHVRTMLSTLPETEYRHYRELLEPYGRNHRQRLTRAYVMPTEQDWVDEVCAEWHERDSKTWHDQHELAACVTSLDQLATAGMRRLPSQNGHSHGVASLVEVFGAASAPILLAALDVETHEYIGKDSMHTVLAGLPSDVVAEYMLQNLVAERTGPFARDIAERFPRRTLRVLARLADKADPSLRSRFTHLFTTTSALGAAHAVAEPDVKDAIDRLLRLDGTPPETADLPEFLASPPWKRKGAKRKKLTVDVDPIDADGLRWREGERERWRHAPDEAQRSTADNNDPTRALAALAKPVNHRSLPPLKGVAAARIAADWLVRLRSTSVSVGDWLDRHGLDVVVWLAPDAIGKAGKPRKAAEAVLRDVARRLGNPAVLEAAEVYGAEAVAAIAEIIEVDPLELDGRKAPKVPAWAEPILGMPVLLRGGERRLPRAAVEHVVETMTLDSLAIPYAGIDIVKETCDPESLTALSWAVFESWEINDAPAKDTWALTQLARFADAGTVERLEKCIRAWPDQRLSKRALNALEVLGAVESEDALRAVHRLTRFRDSKAVKAAATNQVELVAAGLGLDAEQLADRLVPESGPASVTAEQVKRLEKAMANGRTWSVGEFRRHLIGHPLLWELVRRLIWQAETATGPVAFRLAEDRTFADVEDDALDLPDDASVRLTHPVLLGDALPAWTQQLADYEVLQPFDQLGRSAHTPTAAEIEAGRLTRFEGRKARTGPLHGLTRGEWQAVRTDNWTSAIERPVPGGGAVRATFTPGFAGGPYFDAEAPQSIEEVRLPETDLDPVTLAEIITDLEKIAKPE